MVETCWNNKMFNNHSTRFNGMSPYKVTIVCEGLACLILCKLHTTQRAPGGSCEKRCLSCRWSIVLEMLQPQWSPSVEYLRHPNFDASISIFISGGKTRFRRRGRGRMLGGSRELRHFKSSREVRFGSRRHGMTLKRKGEKDCEFVEWWSYRRLKTTFKEMKFDCKVSLRNFGSVLPPPCSITKINVLCLQKKSPKGFLFSIQHYQCALSFSKQNILKA